MLSLFGMSRAACACRDHHRLFLAQILTLAILWALSQAPALAQAPDCQKQGGAADAALCARLQRDKLPPAPPDPAARLSRASVSAAADETTLLTVEAPGRLSIRAQSGAGVALQLVDMMTGPGEIAGERGVHDGRLDVLLDRGVYRLRSFGGTGAYGEAKLAVTPFHSVDGAKPDLLRGGEDSAELGDLEQRSYWVIVSPGAKVSVEAVGRALGDLRLWRNGSDLADLKPVSATVEPEAGHPMTRLRVEGALESGLYLVTAYGGAPAVWADGQSKKPFHIRVGQPQSLAGGWFEGAIGPFGSMRFTIPPPATYVRLELDEPAPAQLSVTRGGGSPESAFIAKTSRQPVATLTVAAKGDEPAIAEVSGLQGQAFRLRALDPSDTLRVDAPGPHLVAVDVAGEGGDELPATVLLARFAKGKGSVVASKALRIARGEAWRAKFNLRGPSSLIFEIANSGPLALRTQGVGVRAVLEPLLGANAPRADGNIPQQWDVEAGWYNLKLEPVRGAVGVIDLTFGQPGLAPAPSPLPSRTVIDFGLQNFDKGAYYQIFGNSGANLTLGPRARKLPADLGASPLIIEQQAQIETPPRAPNEDAPSPPLPPKRPAAGPAPEKPAPKPPGQGAQKPSDQSAIKSAGKPPAKSAPLKVAADAAPGAILAPLRAPLGGAIAAADVNGRPVAIVLSNEIADRNGRTLTATIPASSHNRRVVVTWSKIAPPPEIPVVATPASVPVLTPGQPQFFDLARDESRAFRLDVEEGGLYRIETLGRLKTSAALGTPFTPTINQATGNGAGHNALLQSFLRAGSYRITVKALDSEGHLGLVAQRAALNEAGLLTPGQSARAALTQGQGAVFTIDAPRTATYRLDLYALGKDFPARLEDADGWPLTPPGPMARLEQRIEKGRYRLVVPPVEMDARVVARLSEANVETAPQGHGPHALGFGATQKFQWCEPAIGDAPREPDRWTFSLEGPSHVTLAISDGMSAELSKRGQEPASIAKMAFQRGFDGVLQAGDYELDARAIGRNDRLDYELTLKSLELQPGAPRLIELPASVPFVIGANRIVSLTSFGVIELTGALKDGAGQIIERLNGRIDDWNIALSRRLPAGSYRLDLAATKVEGLSSDELHQPDAANEAPSDEASSDDQAAGAEEADSAEPDDSPKDDADHPETDERRAKIELHLALPETLQGPDLELAGSAEVLGQGAHQLALPVIEEGALLVVAAQSSADAVLSLERRDSDGAWRSVGSDRGRAPVVAAPSDGDQSRPWHVSVWPVEGGASILVAARAAQGAMQGIGQVRLERVPIEGFDPTVEVAAVAADAKSLLILKHAPDGMRAGSAFGRMLRAVKGGVIAPQSERLWFIKRGGGGGAIELDAVPSTMKKISLDLAEGDVATLSQPIAGAGSLRVWRAESSFGQPGLSAGKGMGVAPGGPVAGALALNGGEPLRVWNAGPSGPLRLSLDAFDLTAEPMAQADAQYAATLAPRSAQLVRMASSAKEVEINLAPGAAAFLSGGDRSTTVWGGGQAISRRLSGAWTNILFANIGAEPASVSFATTPITNDKPLATGEARKRFWGAAGSMSLRVEAAAGDRLVTAGAHAAFISDEGAVLKGASLILPGSGELILDHDAGPTAAWVENDEKSPWSATEPQKIEPPRTVSLEGQAMTLALAQGTPMLLNARSTAPVILALSQKEAKGDPVVFPAGAEFHAYVQAGEAQLRIYSPHDGPLSGALEVTLSPLIPIGEGVGEARALAPGGAALFVFDAPRAETIGVGVRSDPDSAKVRLLDANGKSLGEGAAQLRQLEPGRYLIEARAPAEGAALIVRPAVVGLTPPSNGPPPDVAQHYLELVGLRPTRAP